MIKFFRKIRQQLMAENKIGKYLLYAIGEIALVVIGIMIAVALNNSNQIRKTKAEEQNYLLALKEEFEFNQAGLTKMVERNNSNLAASKALLEFVSPKESQLSEEELSGMIENVIKNEVQFSPSPGVLHEITNSGKLGSFRDPALKKALGAWQAQLVRVQFQERDEVHRVRLALINFVNTNINTRRLSFRAFGEKIGYSDSKFKEQNQNLLQSEAFENLLMEFILVSHFLNQTYYTALDERIDEIQRLIETNIISE